MWVDVADTLERKIEALFCHASQLVETGDWFRDFLRERAEAAGRAAGVTYAEAFRRIAVALTGRAAAAARASAAAGWAAPFGLRAQHEHRDRRRRRRAAITVPDERAAEQLEPHDGDVRRGSPGPARGAARPTVGVSGHVVATRP